MANPNFQISFSIDLRPYADGLKSALTMTAATGKQIQPLLNMKMKAPDFSQIEAEFNKYEAQLKEVAQLTDDLPTPKPVDELPPKLDHANKKLDAHASSMKGVEKESRDMLQGLSFLSLSIAGMASEASEGNEKLEKMTRGLNEGISSGFGLAAVMTTTGMATGGTAAAIGALVAVGMTLIPMFQDVKKETDELPQSFDNFKKSMKGATDGAVQYVKAVNDAKLAAAEKELLAKKRALDELKKPAQNNDEKIHIGANALDIQGVTNITMKTGTKAEIEKATKEVDGLQKQVDLLQATAATVGQELIQRQLTVAEVQLKINKAQIDSIADKYKRQIADARRATDDEIELINNSEATVDKKREARIALEKVFTLKKAEILQQQADEEEQKRKENEQKELEHQKLIAGLTAESAKAYNDAEKSKELATAKSARDRVVIEERFALVDLKIQEDSAKAFATSEEEKTALTAKFEALRQKLRSDSSYKFIEADKQDLESAKQRHDEAVRLWKENNQAAMVMVDSINAGVGSMFDQYLMVHREAADAGDAVWMAMENTALQAIANILIKEIETAAIHIGLEETKQTANMTTAATSAVAGTTNAAAGAAAMPFPSSLVFMAAAVTAAYAIFAGIKGAFGFAQGGRIRKGDTGFFEGYRPEIIAPEQTFEQIMRQEFIPRQVAEQSGYAGAGSGSGKLEKNIAELTKAFKKVPTNVQLHGDGRDFHASWMLNDEAYRQELL